MNFTLNELLIDSVGELVTVKSTTTIKDKDTFEIIIQTVQVHQNKRDYKFNELNPYKN
jgi:hypothetical protein